MSLSGQFCTDTETKQQPRPDIQHKNSEENKLAWVKNIQNTPKNKPKTKQI